MAIKEIDQTGEYANYSSRWGARVRLWVLHTEEGNSDAQGLANYFRRAEVSYHYTIDNRTCIDVVDTDYSSWSVLDANPYCINLCFAGSRASMSRSEWLSRFGDAIDYAAKLFVQDAKKYDPLEPVVIDHAAIRAGRAGGTDHYGITKGVGIGNHSDCGPNFPWDVYAAAVAKHSTDYVPPAPVPAPRLIDVEAARAAAWIGARRVDELPTPGDRGGRYAQFEGGFIYWTATTGAHAVPNAILETYASLGYEAGALGYPVGDHTVLTGPDGNAWGDVQGFEGGAVYRRYGQPGFAVWGQIRERWNRSGFETGPFGWPVSNEIPQGDGSVRQEFEHGVIIWSPDGTTALQIAGEPDRIVPDAH